jgi:hypothetical protein
MHKKEDFMEHATTNERTSRRKFKNHPALVPSGSLVLDLTLLVSRSLGDQTAM